METLKRKHLEVLGWKSGTVAEFLELIPEESALAPFPKFPNNSN